MPAATHGRRVRITPKPGFVVKTTTTAPGFYSPPSAADRVAVPPALKVFVNVAYDAAIPAPPTSTVMTPAEEDATIQRAMDGDERSPYFVPVVVSEGRGDVDKAGNPSLVFDAILHPSLKSRITKNVDFRSFVLEIILSHIESPPLAPEKTPPRALTLSRTLATPNIRAKGALAPRDVDVPDFGAYLNEEPEPSIQTATTPQPPTPTKKPLIEELPDQTPTPKSILKKKPAETMSDASDPHVKTAADTQRSTPLWRWEKVSNPNAPDAGNNKLIVELSGFTHADHERSTLFLSPDILTLRTPAHFLQLPLDTVDVERGRAEWRVREARVVIYI